MLSVLISQCTHKQASSPTTCTFVSQRTQKHKHRHTRTTHTQTQKITYVKVCCCCCCHCDVIPVCSCCARHHHPRDNNSSSGSFATTERTHAVAWCCLCRLFLYCIPSVAFSQTDISAHGLLCFFDCLCFLFYFCTNTSETHIIDVSFGIIIIKNQCVRLFLSRRRLFLCPTFFSGLSVCLHFIGLSATAKDTPRGLGGIYTCPFLAFLGCI